jgi:poly(A) polymerase
VIPQETPSNSAPPRVIARSAHAISRQDISREALKVLYRLHRLGYKAYLVGGGVRDLFLKRTPKDFDVATDARPNRLRKIFRNCRVIGRRFRLVHVLFSENNRVEVSTFRRSSDATLKQENGLILHDNTFGTPEEDARRRDLTINGLFYDIGTFSVLDFVGGVEDLQRRIIRTIAEPNESFKEDPVRMIRAIRHAARLDFSIEERTYEALIANRELIQYVNSSRLSEEIYRDLRGGSAAKSFKLLWQTGLMAHVFPELAGDLASASDHPLWSRLEILDRFINEGREYSNAVLAAVLLYTVLLPPELLKGHGREKGHLDLGKAINERIRSMHTHFRLSLQASNRVIQILMARRRIEAVPPDKAFPRQLAGKSYMPETLDFHEIMEHAARRPLEPVRAMRARVEAAFPGRKPEHPEAEDFEGPAAHGPGAPGAENRGRRRRGRRRGRRR